MNVLNVNLVNKYNDLLFNIVHRITDPVFRPKICIILALILFLSSHENVLMGALYTHSQWSGWTHVSATMELILTLCALLEPDCPELRRKD